MTTAIQDTYPEDFAHCFGCGRMNPDGHKIKTYRTADGTATRHIPDDSQIGAGEFAYGGLIASVIDCHSAGSAAIFWMNTNGKTIGSDPTPRFVTARLEVDYLAPTPLGPMDLVGVADEIGDRKVIVSTKLHAGDEVTATGRAILVRITT